jgi:hypothetical protein
LDILFALPGRRDAWNLAGEAFIGFHLFPAFISKLAGR